MTVYYITTFATEDKPQLTCSYPYRQWIDLIKHFNEEGIKFRAWHEHIEM